jgi:hypothetical protein
MNQTTSPTQEKALRYIAAAIQKKESQIADEKKTRDYILSFPVYQLGKLPLIDKNDINKDPSKISVGEKNLREAKELTARWDFSRKQLEAIIEADQTILKAYQAIQTKISGTASGPEEAYIYSDLLNFARIGLSQEQLAEFF